VPPQAVRKINAKTVSTRAVCSASLRTRVYIGLQSFPNLKRPK
jgi:hypothetical protein